MDPIIFKVGSIQVTYYALVYIASFLTATFLLLAIRKKELNMKESEVYDLIILLVLGLFIGARIFHVLFWNLDYFSVNPEKILRIWEGGLSFHGGLLGLFLAGWFYCKIKKVNFWKIADLFALLGVLMGTFLRIANFINQEIVGTLTNVSWCINFKYHEGCRHPVQLYASAGRLILFFILLNIKKKTSKYKEGFIFWLSIFFLGAGRFLLDFLREDAIHLGLKAGQWFSLILLAISVIALAQNHKEDIKLLIKNPK
ncbi:MAG: prolipoprotein diacylglyceryl transferase [archaeon]